MADVGPKRTSTPAQADVERSRQRDYGGPSYGEPYSYEADMVRGSMREQGARAAAKREKNPEYRKYRLQEAEEAHSQMQESARGGLAAREQARQKKRAAAKKRSN